MTPTVSVVITCYNLRRYIGDAIRSVTAQAYDGVVETIVVDDCSTDGSDGVIRSFAGVRHVRTAVNSGVLLAMLDGVDAARGEIIAFLDGDDLWEPSKLALVEAAFAADPATAFVTHDLHYIDAQNRLLQRATRPGLAFAGRGKLAVNEWLRQGILMHSDEVWLGSAFAVHRKRAGLDAFAQFARRLPDPRNTYQDWPMALWIAAQPGLRLDYVPAKLLRYRLHGANHSGDASTSARALRNFKRALNTVAAELMIAERFAVSGAATQRIAAQRDYYAFLVDLYAGACPGPAQWWGAMGFAQGRLNVIAREALRYAGIRLLGAERFARLAARRAH